MDNFTLTSLIEWIVPAVAAITTLTGAVMGWLGFGKERWGRPENDNILLQWQEKPVPLWREEPLTFLLDYLGLTTLVLHGGLMFAAVQQANLDGPIWILAVVLLAGLLLFCGFILGSWLASQLIRSRSLAIGPTGIYRGQTLLTWNQYSHYQADVHTGLIRLYSYKFPYIAADAWQPPQSHFFDQAAIHLSHYLPPFPPTQVPWYKQRLSYLGLITFSTLPFLVAAAIIYTLDYSWAWIYYFLGAVLSTLLATFAPLTDKTSQTNDLQPTKPVVPVPPTPPLPPSPTVEIEKKKTALKYKFARLLWALWPSLLLVLVWTLSYFDPDQSEKWKDPIQLVTTFFFIGQMTLGLLFSSFKSEKKLKEVTELTKQGKYDEALDLLYNHSDKIELPKYLQHRAYILRLKGDFKAATQAISQDIHTKTKALSVNAKKFPYRWLHKISTSVTDPVLAGDYLSLGRIYLDQGAYSQAQKALGYALHLSSKNPLVYAALAHAGAELGDKEAVTLAEHGLQQVKQVPEAALNSLFSQSPHEPGYYYLALGWALFRQGKSEEGLAKLKEGLTAAESIGLPGQAELHYHIGRIHKALGNEATAETAFVQVLKLDPHGRWIKHI